MGRQSKGTSRAGITTKFHAAITGDGRLVEGFLGGGQVADVTVAARLTEDIAGCTVLADRGYDSDAFRRELRGNNNIPVIPGRKNRKKEIVYDKRIYKNRGLIERVFGKLKENRRFALPYRGASRACLLLLAPRTALSLLIGWRGLIVRPAYGGAAYQPCAPRSGARTPPPAFSVPP